METIVAMLNRSIERRVSFEDAYYIVVGDYIEATMVRKIADHEDSSQRLKARAWRWLMLNELSWLKVEV